jgi:MFS family permease
MTVGFTALMVVYQSIPIKHSKCSTSLFDNIADFLCCFWVCNIQIWKSKTYYIRNDRYYFRFLVLFLFHSTEASITVILVLIAVGLSLMQIGSVNIVLTSTPRQFSGISLGMNLLIYLIGSSVGPVIAGILLQANQIFVKSNSISASFPSPESYGLIFLTATLISATSIIFALLINRIRSNRSGDLKEIGVSI